MSDYHTSVLLQETIEGLNIKKGHTYIDGTLGGGGHTAVMLANGARVLGIDVDADALTYVTNTIGDTKQLVLAQGNFKDIDTLAKAHRFEKVSGILLDLGISSHQIDEGSRGFSFQKDAPLDLRMDTSLGVTAADLVNALSKKQLLDLFTTLGEEHYAYRIVENIIRFREKKRIATTGELAKIAERSYPRGYHKIHPATKIFQALRIAVNAEIASLEEVLPKAVSLLEAGGRLVVISFHSLEDRIVKDNFISFEEKKLGTIITKKPIVPTEREIEENKRSRSAKLRIFEKV